MFVFEPRHVPMLAKELEGCLQAALSSQPKPLYGPNGSFSPAHVSYEMGLLRNDQNVSRFQFALALPESDEKNFIRRTNESRVSGTLF